MGEVTVRGVQHLTWIRPGEELRTSRSPLIDGALAQGRVELVAEHDDEPVAAEIVDKGWTGPSVTPDTVMSLVSSPDSAVAEPASFAAGDPEPEAAPKKAPRKRAPRKRTSKKA